MHTRQIVSTSLRAAFAVPALTLCLSACSGSPAHDDPAAAATEEALTPSTIHACPPGPDAIVVAFASPGKTPACPDVPGTGGAWKYTGHPSARTCTATRNPGRGQPYACTYHWSSTSSASAASAASSASPSAPDTRALEAIPDAYVAEASGGATACGDSPMLAYAALLDEAGVTCPALVGSGGPDGPRPCDVCGVPLYPGVMWSSLWLPASSSLHTVSIGLSNGTRQILTLGAAPVTSSPSAASRVRHAYLPIALPDLPAGITYEEGPALGYGYAAPRAP